MTTGYEDSQRPGVEDAIGHRLRVARLTWFALLVCSGFFALNGLLLLAPDRPAAPAGLLPATWPMLATAALAALLPPASFVLRSLLFRRAARLRDAGWATKGYVIPALLCDSSNLLASVLAGAGALPSAYALFALAFLALALHYPRRGAVAAAYGREF